MTKQAVMRLVALAEATEQYSESLDNEQLANIYRGRSLGLLQAARMIAAEAGLCTSGSSGGPKRLGLDDGGGCGRERLARQQQPRRTASGQRRPKQSSD